MRLTAIFLLAAGLSASASGFAQKLTLSEKDAPIGKVFKDIRQLTGYDFLYTDEMLAGAGPVSFDLRDADLGDVLAACFKAQPLSFLIIEKTVVVKPKKAEPVEGSAPTVAATAELHDIHGRVTDSLGSPLVGASVTVKGMKKGTATNERGEFDLKGLNGDEILVISFTGYSTRMVHVNSGELVMVKLQRSSNPLDQAQVIAYGQTSQRLNVGDVTTVSAAEIGRQNVSNPLLALESYVPGLFITQSTGLPGSGVTVRVEGQNSIQSGNDPLYVVDGVPYESQLLPTLLAVQGSSGNTSPTPAGSGSPMQYLNVSDIESISVLKDADATAIYGSRAANGAVLITTKKGKPGKMKVDINAQDGFARMAHELKLLNLRQYLEMRHEAIQNDGLTVGPTDYDINGVWDSTRSTNWQKTLYGAAAQYTNLDASISGGTANTQYIAGGTYHRETTVFPGSLWDAKGSMHFNLNSTSDDRRFNFQLTANYLLDDNHIVTNDPTFYTIEYAPDAPALYNKDGSINWMPNASGTSTWINPVAFLNNTYINKANNLISSSVLSYKLLPSLELRSSFGYTRLESNEIALYPLTAIAPENRPYIARGSSFGTNIINTWDIEPQLNYNKSIGSLKIDGLLGSTILQTNSNGVQYYASGFSNDQDMSDIHSASTVVVNSSLASVYRYNAAFGRLNLNWDDRYILDLSGRRDGSSRFGSANRFHDFGSAGAGWIFSKTDFIREHFGALSFGKLRASIGTTGNDQIGEYQYLSLYQPYSVGLPYQNTVAISPNGLSNPDLQWEKTTKWQIGTDLGFFSDRLLVKLGYYHNESSNELLSYTLSWVSGFGSITKNFPATVQNTGLELSLTTTPVKSSKFTWTLNGNLTIPRNKLARFPNLSSSSYASFLVIGKSLSVRKVFKFAGVNDTTGVYQFVDSKGTVTSNPAWGTDQYVLEDEAPRFYGGIGNSFVYKGLHLDFQLQFTKQQGPNTYFGIGVPGAFAGGTGEEPVSVLGRWQKPGDIAGIQRYNSNFSYSSQFGQAQYSDAGWSDASFIRLRNLSLSWDVPERIIKGSHIGSLRVFAQGQNLLTFTRYKGFDPENLTTYSLPPLRIITFGLHLGL